MTRSRNTRQSVAIVAALLSVAGLAFVVAAAPVTAKSNAPSAAKQTGESFTAVAEKTFPAVVFVKVEKKVAPDNVGLATPFDNDLLKRFFGGQLPGFQLPRGGRRNRVTGQGSGFVTSSDGYILTNNHVVNDAEKVTVKLHDGRELPAKVIGADPRSDVAVLKIDAKDLPVLPLGNSDDLKVGEWVVAVGNPFGLSNTITSGIVSAKERTSVGIADYENFIQTDAAINPGNSGGPLLNLDGRVVGINTAIFTRSGGYMGVGFAIPINMARNIRDQLIKNGSVTRGYLGILIQPLTPELATTFGLKETQGVLIGDVKSGSPADKAALEQGDVIVALGDKPVKDAGSFRNEIALLAPGSRRTLTVFRNGERKTQSVEIGELPASDEATSTAIDNLEKLGLSVQDLTPQLAEQLGYADESGVVVAQVEEGSAAAAAGIRAGALIREVNRVPITNTVEFKQAVAKIPEDGNVLLLVRDGRYSHYVVLKSED